MSRYCDKCEDCHKHKTCKVVDSDCVSYALPIPAGTGTYLEGKECLTVQMTTEDVYKILKDIKSYNTIDFTLLKSKCNKIVYNTIDANKITQNEFNYSIAVEICKLKDQIVTSTITTETIMNLDIRNHISLKCLSTFVDPCDSTSKPIVTFKDLLQAIVNKIC